MGIVRGTAERRTVPAGAGALVLDFTGAPNPDAPQWTVPPVTPGTCGPVAADFEQWNILRKLAATAGWSL